MDKLIRRGALIEAIVNTPTEESGYNPVYLIGCATRQHEILDIINRLPTVDAKPVVHGEWLINADGYYPYCSVCKDEPVHGILTNYCGNCGADMRKKVQE